MAIKLTEENDTESSDSGILLLRETGSLGIGDVNRYKIIVDKNKLLSDGIECTDDTLYLEFKTRRARF